MMIKKDQRQPQQTHTHTRNKGQIYRNNIMATLLTREKKRKITSFEFFFIHIPDTMMT